MVSEARKQGIELRDAPYAIEESVSKSNLPEDEIETWKSLEWKPEVYTYLISVAANPCPSLNVTNNFVD